MKKRPEQDFSRQGSQKSTNSDNRGSQSREHTKTTSLLSNFRKLSKPTKSSEEPQIPYVISNPQPIVSNRRMNDLTSTSPSKRNPSNGSVFSSNSQISLPLSHSTSLNHSNTASVFDSTPSSPERSRRSSQFTLNQPPPPSLYNESFKNTTLTNPIEEFKTPIRRTGLQRMQTNVSVMTNSSIISDDFNGENRPASPVVDQYFDELMTKRDFKSLPEAAKKQMKEYSTDKKWMLVRQDVISEKKKQERTKKTGESVATPEVYVRYLMDKSISVRQLGNLWVSLRTEPVDWVKDFIDLQGPVALANVLQQLHSKTPTELLNDDFLEKEISIVRCLRTIINSQKGANYALDCKIVVPSITGALISTKLPTRKLVTDMLIFLAHCQPPEGYNQVLKALNTIPSENIHFQAKQLDRRNSLTNSNSNDLKRFEQWLKIVEQTMEGRGKLGSLVGASDEIKSTGSNGESQLIDYALATVILINSVAQGGEDFKIRTHTRAQLKSGGVQRIFKKFQTLHNELIDDKIREYEDSAAEDYEALLTSERIGGDVDLNDPVSLVNNIWKKLQHSEAEGYFLSAMQHLFLNQADPNKSVDSPEFTRSLRLVDGLISNIAMGGGFSSDDAALNVAIHRLYDGLQTDDVARRAIIESREATKKAEEAIAERDELTRQISLGSNGMMTKISNELKEQEIILLKQRRLNERLASELEELKRKHILEKHEQELEMREILIALNNTTEASGKSTRELAQRLKGKIVVKKNQIKSENKKYGTVEPNGRLRALRDQMEDIEQQARELEMTNFVDKKRNHDSVASSVHSSPEKIIVKKEITNSKEEDLFRIEALRKRLEALQNQSNDILKFDTDAKKKELMNRQRLMAMDRLKELQSRFENLNIDFSTPNVVDASVYHSLDPKQNYDIHKELDEIERIGDKLQKELVLNPVNLNEERTNHQVVDTPPTRSFLESLEDKYARGKKEVAKADFNYRPLAVAKIRSSRGFEPAFLKELTSSVGKKDAIPDIPASQSIAVDEKRETITPIEIPPNSLMTSEPDVALRNPPSVSASVIVPAPPPPSPPPSFTSVIPSSADPPPPPPAFLNRSNSDTTSPPPPPPPPPSFLPNSRSATPPAPPPPPPFLGGSGGPPPPPPPPFFGGSGGPPPPPPPFGAIPPPPPFPIPGSAVSPMIGQILPQSPSLFEGYPRPKKKLKQLHWEKVENTENSVWEENQAHYIANDLLNRGIFEELEKIFPAKEIKSLKSKKAGEKDKLTFLARDISQQFSINLHMFSSLTEEQLVNKILRCDRSVLESSSVIEFLSKPELNEIPNGLARNLEPYRTDWTRGSEKSPEKDPNDLHRSDRIFLELFFNLHDYWPSRMRALKVVTTFEKEYTDIVTKLRAIDEATEGIQNSTQLRKVFDIILAVGNYMNDSNKQAQGFKLSTLQRLTFMKDDKNSYTFLHYVEKIVRTAYPEVEQFIEDISKAADVAKISIELLANDSRDFSNSVKNVEASIDIGNLSDSSKFHPDDKVLVKVRPILPEARRKADLLKDQTNITMQQVEDLMRYFGEDPSDKFAMNSFFKKFVDFVNDYKRAAKENIAREEEERLYEQRKKALETKKAKDQAAAEAQAQAGENVMDSLLEKLRAAGPPKGQGSSARKRAQARKNLMKLKNRNTEEEENNSDDIDDDDDAGSIFSHGDSPSKSTAVLVSSGGLSSDTFSDPLNSGLTGTASLSVPEEEDFQSRARNLLNELRGGNNPTTPSRTSSFGNGDNPALSRAQLLRQQQIQRRRQSSGLSLTQDEIKDGLTGVLSRRSSSSDAAVIDITKETTPPFIQNDRFVDAIPEEEDSKDEARRKEIIALENKEKVQNKKVDNEKEKEEEDTEFQDSEKNNIEITKEIS